MSASAAPADAPVGEPGAAGAGYLRSTFRHGAVYGLGMLLARAIGFLMLPVYTRVLTPADYGILELLSMTTDVVGLLTGIGLTWSVTRYYYYYRDPADRAAVVSSATILLVAFFALASAVALPFAGPLAALVLGDDALAPLFRLAIAGLFLSSFLEIPLVFLRAKQDSTRVVVVSLARLALALGLNILFVVVLRQGVAGVLYGTILTSATVGAYLLASTLRETGLRFSRPVAAKLLTYGAPIVAANLGSFVIHYSDRYLLRAYGSLESVGLYSLAYKFAMLLSLFIATPFSQIWAPKALEIERAEGDGARPVLRRIIDHYNLVLVVGALGLALFAGDAIRIMASAEFHAAGRLVPLLCLGMLFFGYRQISYIGPSIRERSDLIALGTVAGTVVVVGANFALIPRWGALGAALATVAAFAAEFAVVLACAERVYPLRYPLGRLFLPVAAAAAVYGGLGLVLPASAPLYLTIPAKLVALAGFAALAAVGGRIYPARRSATLQAIRVPMMRPRTPNAE